MKKLISTALVAAALSISGGAIAQESAKAVSLDQLLNQVKTERKSDGKLNKAREAEFSSERADKAALLKKAKSQLAAEKKRGEDLSRRFSDNEQNINQLNVDLQTAIADLGEMFGVVRQVSNDTAGLIDASLISAQYPGREDVMFKLAQAKELPTIKELEELWIALQTEMTESGKVVSFTAPVTDSNGNVAEQKVTRVGAFTLLSEGEYLSYNAETGTILQLPKQPEGFKVGTVKNFLGAGAGEFTDTYVDPSKGALLQVYTQKASLEEKFHQGGTVGYIIAALLGFGLVIALWKVIALTISSAQIRSQMKNVDNPGNNALGRILKVYTDNKNVDVETLELKIDEAILKETPKIERGIPLIKVLAAIAPMLGLLGTVTGMIKTFENITLFGTGDPQIMAGGISMALVTTVLGLIAALPLILVHALVAGRARSVVDVLEEQSAGIVAAHAEARGK